MAPKSREVGIRLSVKDAEVAKRALAAFGTDGQAALKRIENAGKPASVSLHALNAATGGARAAISGFVSGAVAGIVPILSLSAAISSTRAALEKFGAIADQSKRSGLDTEFFQGIAQQAKLAGIEVGTTAAALATFAQNSGLAAEGRGRMVTTLKALNPELLRNIQLATTQEERVRLAADAINAATSAAEKAALSGALFQNKDLAAAFEGGAAALDDFVRKGRELGLIVDRDVIARADELGDSLDTASEIIDNNLKQALLNLAPGLANFAGWVAIISANIRDMVDATKALEDRSSATLNNQLRDLGIADVGLENRAIDVQGRLNNPSLLDQLNRGALEAELAKIKAEREANQAQQKAILDQLATRTPVEPVVPLDTPDLPTSDEAKAAIKEAEALTKRLRTATEEYAATIADLGQKQAAGLISQETYNRAAGEAALKFAAAADGSDAYAEALARLDQAKAAGIITEKQYTDAVESLTKRRLIAQNDWVAGVQLGLMQIADGADEVTSSVAQAVSGWAESLGTQVGDVFRTGKFAWQDLVKTMLADIAKLATQQFITKPLAGLLGSVFGGLLGGGGGLTPQPVTNIGFGSYGSFDTGGWTGDGNPADPAGMVHRKEFVVKAGPAARYRSALEAINEGRSLAGGGAITLAPTYNVDGSSLSPGQLLAVLDQHSSMLLDRVSGIVKRDVKNGVFN